MHDEDGAACNMVSIHCSSRRGVARTTVLALVKGFGIESGNSEALGEVLVADCTGSKLGTAMVGSRLVERSIGRWSGTSSASTWLAMRRCCGTPSARLNARR